MPSRKLGLWMAFVTAFLWAILVIKLKLALEYIDEISIVWFRLSFAFLFIFIYKLITAPKDLSILKSPPLLGICSSLGLGLNYFFYMKGVDLTSASNAQVLIQLAPLGLILVGVFIFKETPKAIQIFGFGLALAGFIFFYIDQIQVTSLSGQDNLKVGNLWIIIAALCWVIFAVLQKPLLKKYEAQQLNLLLYGVAALLMMPFAHWSSFLHLPVQGWLLLIACGLNTVVAYGALPIAFQNLPTSQVSVIIAANPLLTIFIMSFISLFQVSWIKPEHIAGLGYFAAGLVVTGVILVVTAKSGEKLLSKDEII
jgi:drug/metabolite transporter (DMT)-like permease